MKENKYRNSDNDTRRQGHGYLYQIIVQAILAGGRELPEIRKRTKSHASGAVLETVLQNMQARGFLARGGGGYNVTPKGMQCLPATSPLNTSPPYIPPPSQPRRPGSSTDHIPSLVAGQCIEYAPHL